MSNPGDMECREKHPWFKWGLESGLQGYTIDFDSDEYSSPERKEFRAFYEAGHKEGKLIRLLKGGLEHG